eukprot:gene57631-78962_t
MAGNLGLVLAQDAASFYVFFALMSFASYGLVVHSRTPEALHAGRVYLALVVLGELALFAAIALAWQAAGSLNFADIGPALAVSPWRDAVIGLTLVGFGIKVGALPLHVWLPLAHPVAPTPASAVLVRAWRFADEIDAPVDPVGTVNIGVAGRAEHHAVPRRLADIG